MCTTTEKMQQTIMRQVADIVYGRYDGMGSYALSVPHASRIIYSFGVSLQTLSALHLERLYNLRTIELDKYVHDFVVHVRI